MTKILFILTLICCFQGVSQNGAVFKNGNDAYNEGDYVKATDLYLEILEKGEHSAELYFNLGNVYYKLNQTAPSIYYFEKALMLKPNDPEIKNNLGYAQKMTLDAIEVLPETGLVNLYKKITGVLSFDQWSYTAIIFMSLFVLLYIAFYFFRYSTKKRIAFIGSLLFLLLSIIAVVFAFVEYRDFNANNSAIVFSQESQVKAEPNNRSQQIFILHEGTKVNVLEELGEWKRIRLTDGKTGWIASESIKLLKDF